MEEYNLNKQPLIVDNNDNERKEVEKYNIRKVIGFTSGCY